MPKAEPVTAMLRSNPGQCARCRASTEYVCWWHPDTTVCLECPCPECGDRETWLAGWFLPLAALVIILLGLVVADSIWDDQGRPLPPPAEAREP